ncbi:MAG: NAD-dependent epimerase/dehydratase family protein, partial [Gammaproteobacteria bacterium]|nr:NAD-dependent epimerase/dehydratase family protein [Gammaproteobacteria bacterium]
MPQIVVTGAFGQIGSELTSALREQYGPANVVATGRRVPKAASSTGPAEVLDVTDAASVQDTFRRLEPDIVYHLAARLSAVAEQDPESAWNVNVEGLRNVLRAAHDVAAERMFWPSSIAAFGPDTPRTAVPQDTIMRPTTIYGIAKVAGELLCNYYLARYGLDVRGVRYPGVISSGSPPGGGTTDYAVEIFYAALQQGKYTAFVREDCVLPMIYMPDCINAATKLMQAPRERLLHHNSFNVTAMSFSAGELAREIQRH